MRISRKLVSIAAAGALVAGAGLATAAPASAATMKGTTTITIDTAVVVAGVGAGLGIYAGGPATSSLNSNKSLAISLPAKQKDGAGDPITHKGSIVFTHATAGGLKMVTCANPSISAGEATTTISCVVTGLAPAFATLEGKVAPVMVLEDIKTNKKKGTITGTVVLNANVDLALNASLETQAFQPGMTLGTAKVTLK